MGQINITAISLAIWSMRTAYIGAFVIIQSQPAQTIHDFLF